MRASTVKPADVAVPSLGGHADAPGMVPDAGAYLRDDARHDRQHSGAGCGGQHLRARRGRSVETRPQAGEIASRRPHGERLGRGGRPGPTLAPCARYQDPWRGRTGAAVLEAAGDLLATAVAGCSSQLPAMTWQPQSADEPMSLGLRAVGPPSAKVSGLPSLPSSAARLKIGVPAPPHSTNCGAVLAAAQRPRRWGQPHGTGLSSSALWRRGVGRRCQPRRRLFPVPDRTGARRRGRRSTLVAGIVGSRGGDGDHSGASPRCRGTGGWRPAPRRSPWRRRARRRRPSRSAGPPAGCRPRPRWPGGDVERDRRRSRCGRRRSRPRPAPTTRPGSRFMAGEPMKVATKRVAGRR